MSDSVLDPRRKALEDSYFQKKNQEALEFLAKELEKKERLSPLTDKPLKESIFHGVIVYTCEDTNGVWVEGSQLERLFSEIESEEASAAGVKWDQSFFEALCHEAKEDIPHGALKIAKEAQGDLLSPVTREPMVKFELLGVVLDRCEHSGGIWFDANELENLLEKGLHPDEDTEITPHWVHTLFKAIGYK